VSSLDRMAAVPEHLRELVLRQLAGESAPQRSDQPITPVSRSGHLPMSPAQQGLWFLSELDPDSVEYNAMWVLRLRGELNVDALTTAVNRVVGRHEALRTTFDESSGRGIQVVHEHIEVPVPLLDFAGAEADAALEKHLRDDMSSPFDLRRGPLVRASLIRMGPRDHVLPVSMHHIVCDGWSFGRLFGELAEVYAAETGGAEAQLAALPVQYPDFAAWQQNRMAEGGLDVQLAYWQKQLDGMSAAELPTDRPRPPVRTAAGAAHVFEVPAPLVSRLRDLGRDSGATLFMALAAAVKLLLSRYSGEQDVAVGTVTSGRGRPELDTLIGLFINTLVVRSHVDESATFAEFLAQLRSTVLDAFDNQDVPFQRVVDVLRPDRDPSRPPLVQVMVNLTDMGELPSFPGLEVSDLKPPILVSKMDLTFDFFVEGESLTCLLEYSVDLFDQSTIERMSRHVLTLLDSVADRRDQPMHALRMLTEAERHELTSAWQGAEVESGPVRCVHELFDERAARCPDEIAVSCGDDRLTFAGLAARANRLAQYLASQGVGPGVLVGVCLDRGVDAVVALLGVLKAGGAFVPLDPDHPAARLTTMLADAAVSLVVTQHRLRDRISGHADSACPVLYLDRDGDVLDDMPAHPPEVTVSPGDPAYVVYTSGSTGTPKGVLVSHRNVHYIVHAWNDHYGLAGLRGRCLAVSSFGVDLFFGDFLLSTLFGGELVVCPSDVLADPPALAALLVQAAPEIMVTTPSLLKAIARELTWAGGSLKSLRVLAVGSEPWLTHDCLELLGRLDPDAVVTNNYGATETTVDSTVFRLRDEAVGASAIVPIGRPLANTRVYVLDSRMRPVPVGVSGELYVGGGGVAAGYRNRPELTGQRFLPDTFTAAPDARLYRTGDVGRWRADGNLEITGRVDDQVKVRGFRVELGEVETAVARHAGITAAAAAVRRDEAGRDRLVAYVVAAGGHTPDLGELRAFLADILPDPAVPSALVVLDALPMTSSGTLDRRVLPTPDRVERKAEGYVAPRTPVETALVAAWAEVLGLDDGDVGVADNFFGLGGDSILGLQVVSLARRAGLRLTAKQIFVRQTIAELATVVTVEDTPRTVSGPATGDACLTPVQHEFFESYPDGPAQYNQSVFLELTSEVDAEALGTAFAALLDHHDAFRLRFERTATGWRQYYAETGPGDVFRAIDLSTLDAASQDHAMGAVISATQSGLRPGTGPVAGAVVFGLGHDRPSRLFVTVHHLVVDGVSWRILLSDLDVAYRDAAEGRQVRLEPVPSSYRDWSDRLHDAVATGRFDDELEHWSRTEQAIENGPDLPVDRPGDNVLSTAATVSVRLDADLTRALLQDVPAVYQTRVNDVLLSALVTVLSAWTGGDTVGVELEGHGREDLFDDVDLSRTVGWFTSVFPVALTVPAAAPEPDWATVIRSVKEQLRAVPTAGLGYGALRYLGDGDVLGRGSGCQVGFNYHGRLDVAAGSAEDGVYREWLASPGGERSPDLVRQNLIEVVGLVRQGELRFEWEYSTAVHRAETVARLAEEFADALARIVEHCARPGVGGRTPSDFPLSGLDQDGVDRIAGDGRSVADIYPLTPMQSGLLFHSLDAHETDIYFTHFGVELDGVTDPEVLALAWQCVVDRTPILRTAVAGAEGRVPLQVVYRDVSLPADQHDWRGLAEPEQRARIERLWADCTRVELDLASPPLLRLAIARLSETCVYMLCSSHHILLDGWSFMDVLAEVFEQHAALTGGRETEPKARRPYREYVRWLSEQDEAVAADYWRRTMAGFTAPTPLPFDRAPLRAHESHDSAWFDLVLTPENTGQLLGFGRDARVTVNTVLQGAWAMMLSRYSGERDVCFGTTVSGRPAELAGSDEMIGLFINTLPVRVAVDSGQDVLAWLRRMQEQQADARQYEYVSLTQARQWSEIAPGRNLFETVVVFENFPHDDAAAERNGLRMRGLTGRESSNYPLTCVAYVTDALHMRFGYDPTLFDEQTARSMSEHLLGLLREIVAAPHRTLRRLAVACDAGSRRQLVGLGVPAAGYPDQCLHEVVARHAEHTPDAPAVVVGSDTLTYGALNARADRLAGELVGRGARQESPVAIYLDGGPEFVTAMLAVLKAGGAYLPIDPGYPRERVSYLLTDSAVSLVLTGTALAGRLPETEAEVICLDERAEPDRRRDALPAVRLTPDNLAALIYTSGSTGAPKGTMLTHRGLVRLVLSGGAHTFDGAEVIAQHLSLSFDAAQNELWNALLTGSCLAVRPGGFRSVSALDEFLRANQVTAMSIPAGFFHAIADTAPEILAGLKKVVVGAEALSPVHCSRVRERLPHLEIVNAYGPTECSVTATCFPLVPADGSGSSWQPVAEDASVPIGRPVAGTAVYVLDRDLNIVPTGVAGEAYIAGDGVTRGLWRRPSMTADRFVANPFGPPGARMYRTGDLVRARSDGNLVFVGRVDDQVKVRGFRIELGEVEQALAAHPGVARAAVLAREDRPGVKRLVAYVVATEDDAVEPKGLRAFLAEKLPEHMVPAAFAVLDQLPLTAHGKLDRRALPAPDQESTGQPHVAPRTPAEETLAGIWSDVLGVPRVGVEDNFFSLGGDSILSIQVVFQSRRAGVPVSSSDLFRYPTIAELAALAGRGEQVTATQDAVTGDIPLMPIQREFFARHGAAPNQLTQSVLVELAHDVDLDALHLAFSSVLAQHDALRMRYRCTDGTWSQYNAAVEDNDVLSRHDLSGVDEAGRMAAMRELAVAADSTMVLEHGPLVRALVFELGPGQRPWMHLTAHHLVIDTVSWRMVSDDLDTAYRQAANGEPVDLGAKTSSFQQWANRLAGHVAEGGFDADLDYWTTLPASTPLPTDGDGPNVVSSRRTLRFSLTERETDALLHMAPGVFRARVNDVLLAGLAWTLSRWSGGNQLLFEMEGHGREDIFDDIDLSRTVGWFTSCYPVLLTLPSLAEEDWTAVVRSVRRSLRAVPGNGLSYGALRHLGAPGTPAAALADRPVPEVLFNYHSQIDEITRTDGRRLYHAFHDSIGQEQNPAERAAQLLDVVGVAQHGRLGFELYYSTNVHDTPTIERVAREFRAALGALARHSDPTVDEVTEP
jgi:amino acid adenylation domain-containing protein/non-ribosomal peptide synthase protein (TIGR01720 family)